MSKYVVVWVPMVLIAIANGALRQAWYGQHVGELQAHQISTASGLLLFGVYIWIVIAVWRPESSGQALAVGLLWLGLTVVFEFVFGRYVAGHPWSKLLQDYNLLAGRVWVIVLLFVTLGPYGAYRLQR